MNRRSNSAESTLWQDGLWTQNPALVKLLGLCPMLAVSNTAVNGIGLGVATLLTLMMSSATVSLLRHHLDDSVRLPMQVGIIATIVTAIEIAMAAWLPGLHETLGIFLPLIVTNCLILGRSEAYASRQPVRNSVHDAAAMGIGFLWVLVVLGAGREVIGQGTLFSDAHLLHSSLSGHLMLFDARSGVLLALLPPGAFIGLGLLLAVYNVIEHRRNRRRERVMVTSSSTPETAAY